jgi:hypothetical protein
MFKKRKGRRIFRVAAFIGLDGEKVSVFEQSTVVMCQCITDGVCEPHSPNIFTQVKIGDCFMETIMLEPLS